MQRRSVILAMACAGLGVLTGCASSTPPVRRTIRSYTEEVSSILITADDKQIVFLGARYHYIFSAPPELLSVLRSSIHASLVAEFNPFTVFEDQRIVGEFSLKLVTNAIETQKKEVRDNIFQLNNIFLEGERFSASNISDAKLEPLQHSYHVNINESSGDGYWHSPEVSPIQKVAGGILLIGLIPLLLVTGLALPCCGSGH
ncbi:hypothetical protein [Pseudomonas lini]